MGEGGDFKPLDDPISHQTEHVTFHDFKQIWKNESERDIFVRKA